ncbi:phosphonoacetate hydrolase [Bradyrhizobium sp. 83012]|uniref:Phosphonoacetate hydrolase n=1 Tax=Bradyrhizobium aeschynomenes TaxID=2734909 RepID=A0ABX2CDL9_9BRAD|nr:phosphonoacetate hydrolase [Bradyrhizobium aeschynomenes]NPU66319.1 phosphonoacetate hydrolase [Bradyrhizobium aeschynomenes]
MQYLSATEPTPGSDTQIEVNGRAYNWPRVSTVIICFDGCDPDYIAAASAAGSIPAIDRMRRDGFATTALAAMPTFTNPNNVSIVTGVAPAHHGVSGNFYIDRASGQEVMMVDASPMRAPTILSAFSHAGAKVAAVTAKDKLRKALGKDLKGIVFSAEKADCCSEAENGITNVPARIGRSVPHQYSADLSLFVLDAGVRLLEDHRPDLMYLSLSDYVQHAYAPDEPEALAFMAEVDHRLGALHAAGAVVGIVADHGMSDMARADGSPNVIYLGDQLDAVFGLKRTRVICPITDPFVRHHGALGGFVRVHLLDPSLRASDVVSFLAGLPGVGLALTGDDAAARFELPRDREGDVCVIAATGIALGARTCDHELSNLAGARLRSHGGLAEQHVPFILSHRLRAGHDAPDERTLRNFDIFSVALNEVDL